MSIKTTEGKIMQIRVHENTYRALLDAKAKVEQETGEPASFDDAIHYILEVEQ